MRIIRVSRNISLAHGLCSNSKFWGKFDQINKKISRENISEDCLQKRIFIIIWLKNLKKIFSTSCGRVRKNIFFTRPVSGNTTYFYFRLSTTKFWSLEFRFWVLILTDDSNILILLIWLSILPIWKCCCHSSKSQWAYIAEVLINLISNLSSLVYYNCI